MQGETWKEPAGASSVQFEHLLAPAADHVAPAEQLPQTASDVAVQFEARNLPAAQPPAKLQVVHGANPELDHEVPGTQVAAATHELVGTSQAYAGLLQEQLVWPVLVLLAL